MLLSKESGELARVHWIDPGCRVDASGLRVSWLADVDTVESASLLERFVLDDSVPEKAAREALQALAGHDVAAVTSTLEGIARSGRTWKLRKQALFWLGAARGVEGVRALGGILDGETSDEMLEQAVFGLHVSDEPEALSRLLTAARGHARAAVRAKALFWLAQEAGRAASEAIADAVREDPEYEVKKRAVFALSQLSPEEGVPLLVELARDHPDPRIQKKAFFWLGQSGHPTALEFLERVLTASP